jgi:glycosyltransferase involved in cell wall biosynthesis
MRLLFVVQRYGREVAGGAELHCRQFATKLAGRGHDVDVLTSCAVDYMDWANKYPPGLAELDGVQVHRLPVATPRDLRFFTPLDARTVWGHKPQPLHLQRAWMQSQGPYIPELPTWLRDNCGAYDITIFFTYLYFTTWAGLPAASSVGPTVLHPTAHDEPSLRLSLFDSMFRLPSGFALSTEEESALVRDRFRVRRPERIIGIGVDLDVPAVDDQTFRDRFRLGDRPYLLYVGRLDIGKGVGELVNFFAAYKERNPGPLALVLLGQAVQALPAHPDVVLTGFVDDDVRQSALAGALALVQPSYFESFSMVLSEAWAQRKCALVNGRCAVLDGQVRRSGGGLPYRGFAEFEAAVDVLVGDAELPRRLGAAGRRYVERRYEWDTVLSTYETFCGRIASKRFTSSPPAA